MKEMNAQEAYDLLQKDPDYLYLDVRSMPEFEQGLGSADWTFFNPKIGFRYDVILNQRVE